MLEAELQRLRDDNTAIAELMKSWRPPRTAAPARATVSGHGRCDGPAEPGLCDGADMVGSMKRMIRDRTLQHTLAADFSPQETRLKR